MSEPFEIAPTVPPEASLPDEDSSSLGQVIDGRYRLIRKLGEGGMGAVYLAEHLSLQKQVALKMIHRSFDGHAEIAARFAREAMASARIEHPHVVSALDYGTLAEGSAFLVMQLARGEGLRARMEREGALPFALASQIIEQMADAVAAAHAAGIVHRDLKPENVVLEPTDGEQVHVRVLDFGIAHLRSEPESTAQQAAGAPLTRLGVVMGTPGYMAPEQALGQPVDERTDIYALGVMLWELCAGRPPFEGDTLTAIVSKQLATNTPALPRDIHGAPAALGAFIDKLLAPMPENRLGSASELRDQLRVLRTGRGEQAPRTAALTRPMRVLAALVALVVVLLIALLSRSGEPASTSPIAAETTPSAPAPPLEPGAGGAPSAEPAARAGSPPADVDAQPAEAEAQPHEAESNKARVRTRRGKSSTRRENIGSRVRRSVNSIFR